MHRVRPPVRAMAGLPITLGRVLLLASALSLSCAGPRVAPEKPAGDDRRRYIAFEALDSRDLHLNAHDAAGAAAQYAVDAEILDVATGAVIVRGRDAIERDLRELFARCPSFAIDVLDRSYSEQGRFVFVSDLERVRCGRRAAPEEAVRYEVGDAGIVRVWRLGGGPRP